MAGLAHAKGDWVYLTDIDLEEQPEWLTQFHAELTSGGHDVVFGQQRQRIGSALDNLMPLTGDKVGVSGNPTGI